MEVYFGDQPLSYEVLSLITNRSKQLFQTAISAGYGIKITHFVVGSAGHDPDSPITALTPDPNYSPTPDNATGHRLPPDAIMDPKAITNYTDHPDYITVWQCDLDKGEATGEISSLYLLAKIVSPTTHSLYDLMWVWSVVYMPLNVKLDTDVWSYDVGVVY